MKHSIDELALFGGAPAFADKLHVGRPNVGDRAFFMQRVEQILDSRWFTNNGSCVQELEARLAEYLNVKHCIAVCNATVGLETAIRAVGYSGEVIVPSMTFVATAHALQWQQITPVFCDVDPRTHLIDPQCIESRITPRTSGILAVHLWGRACPVEALEEIASRNGLKLMFDAAHAFGCSYRGRKIGGFGAAEVFSFHATKFFNSFEGGAITTNDDDLAAKIRLMTNFGFAGYDNVVYIGTNGKMHEVSAAMGLASLRAVDTFIATNRDNYACYERHLKGIPGLRLLGFDDAETNNWQYVVALYDAPSAGISRDALVDLLWAENVIARRYFYPGCHRMEPYRTLYPGAGMHLPHTERVVGELLILPTGTAVGAAEIERICALLRLGIVHGAAIRERQSRQAATA